MGPRADARGHPPWPAILTFLKKSGYNSLYFLLFFFYNLPNGELMASRETSIQKPKESQGQRIFRPLSSSGMAGGAQL